MLAVGSPLGLADAVTSGTAPAMGRTISIAGCGSQLHSGRAYNAPWYGSLTGKVPAGQAVTGIAAG